MQNTKGRFFRGIRSFVRNLTSVKTPTSSNRSNGTKNYTIWSNIFLVSSISLHKRRSSRSVKDNSSRPFSSD